MDLISRHVPGLAEQAALVQGERTFTWAELNRDVARLSAGLERETFEGELLGIWLPNSRELLVTVLACLSSGIVPMPLAAEMKWPEARSILGYSRVKRLITTAAIAHACAGELAGAGLAAIHAVGADTPVCGFRSFDALLADAGSSGRKLPPEAPGLVLHTSGTNGRPKAVMLSRRGLAHILDYRLRHTKLSSRSVSVVASCLAQSVGLYQALALAAAGATIVLLRDYDTECMAECVNRHRPSHLIMVVDALDRLLHHPAITRDSLANLVFAAAGADRVTARVQQRFMDLAGRPLASTYGLTESSWALVNPGDRADKMLALGRPAPGIEVRVYGRDGNELPDGEVGEIRIRSPRNMLGYLDEEGATREAFAGEWLLSGDLAWRDAEGWYWFAGRSKNVIALASGDLVSPVEVENALLAHPAVAACAVVGVKGADGSGCTTEWPLAFVTLRAEAASELVLRAFLAPRISDYKIPRRFIFLSEIPMNPAGKVKREELARLAAEVA